MVQLPVLPVVALMHFCKRKYSTAIFNQNLIFNPSTSGQQFAQQMQEANPELVEQLKSAFKKPGDENQDGNPDKDQS